MAETESERLHRLDHEAKVDTDILIRSIKSKEEWEARQDEISASKTKRYEANRNLRRYYETRHSKNLDRKKEEVIQETQHYPIIAVRISLVTYSMVLELNHGVQPPEQSLDEPTYLIYETDPNKRNTIIPEGYFKEKYYLIGGDPSNACVVAEKEDAFPKKEEEDD